MSVSFHTLTIADVVEETSEARSIRFAVPEELRRLLGVGPPGNGAPQYQGAASTLGSPV